VVCRSGPVWPQFLPVHEERPPKFRLNSWHIHLAHKECHNGCKKEVGKKEDRQEKDRKESCQEEVCQEVREKSCGTLQEISNKDLRGKRVILNIFPSIDTPTCATSTRTFNALASSLNNTEVYCVSADLPFAQGRFCGSEGLANVKTASSFRSNFGKAFGVNLTDGVLKGILARAVVVLDEKGKVLHSELVSEIANEPNYEAAINSLR
jgi:thiol peroxidase